MSKSTESAVAIWLVFGDQAEKTSANTPMNAPNVANRPRPIIVLGLATTVPRVRCIARNQLVTASDHRKPMMHRNVNAKWVPLRDLEALFSMVKTAL